MPRDHDGRATRGSGNAKAILAPSLLVVALAAAVLVFAMAWSVA